MDPINYDIDVKSPVESALQGYQGGFAVRAADQQAQARQLMQQDLNKVATNPNAGAKEYAGLIIKYPQLSESLKRGYDILNADQQQQTLSQATQVYAALQNNRPDAALKLLDDRAQAAKNSGNQQEADAATAMKQLIQLHPESAKSSTALMLAATLGPDKFTNTFATLEKLPSEVQKNQADATKATAEAAATPQRLALENNRTAAQVRDIDSQITNRAGQLNLDQDKLRSDVELKLYELNNKNNQLDDGAKKLINDAAVNSVTASQTANQLTNLADQLEKAGGGYGAFSTAGEWLKGVTGNQGQMTQLRNEYVRLRNNQALKMLPPGSASDKDISLTLKGFPAETADASVMASFLRGMAKLQDYNAATEDAKSEWVNAVGHLGKPKTDIEVDGIKVPKGSSFSDFSAQFLSKKAEEKAQARDQATLSNRSYMRFAQPGGTNGQQQ